MSAGLGVARLVTLALGLTSVLAGLAIVVFAGGEAVVTGFWAIGLGAVIFIAALIERVRYRSDASDRSGIPAGPGGGEPPGTRLDPRFRRSDEVFSDPTSGHRMRVWLDPASGERRYVAED